MAPCGLYARLCHAFLVLLIVSYWIYKTFNFASPRSVILTFAIVSYRTVAFCYVAMIYNCDSGLFSRRVKLKFHGSSYLVASSWHPREDVRNKSGVSARILARISQECYAENGPMEFKLIRLTDRYTLKVSSHRMRSFALCAVRRRVTPYGTARRRTAMQRSAPHPCPRTLNYAGNKQI